MTNETKVGIKKMLKGALLEEILVETPQCSTLFWGACDLFFFLGSIYMLHATASELLKQEDAISSSASP